MGRGRAESGKESFCAEHVCLVPIESFDIGLGPDAAQGALVSDEKITCCCM